MKICPLRSVVFYATTHKYVLPARQTENLMKEAVAFRNFANVPKIRKEPGHFNNI
jgi:hypothetical protein